MTNKIKGPFGILHGLWFSTMSKKLSFDIVKSFKSRFLVKKKRECKDEIEAAIEELDCLIVEYKEKSKACEIKGHSGYSGYSGHVGNSGQSGYSGIKIEVPSDVGEDEKLDYAGPR